jgi:L-asparaginase II
MVRVVRSGLEESVHEGDLAVVDAEGRLVAWAGEPDRVLFARSSMKPLQATVSMSLAPLDWTDREVAVMCASHNAEPVHLEAVRAVLARGGVPEEALRCPAVRPWDDERLGEEPGRDRINSDCSGKHAGMLSACAAQGWPIDGYRDRDHPLQGRILEAVGAASGVASPHLGVDGCGVVVHGMPLASMATIYARLARPERLGELAPFAARAVEAMGAQPYLVAGRNRPDTALMEATPGLVAKGGAEGLMCVAILDRGWGLALRIRDGGSGRASGPAAIHALRALGCLSEERLERLAPFARPAVLGGGEPVGELVADFEVAVAES